VSFDQHSKHSSGSNSLAIVTSSRLFEGINYFADLKMTFRQNFFLQDWFRNEFVVGLG
jgi:hypothetical protein